LGPFRRIYRVRFLTAFFVCLPGILLCAWYAWSAFAEFDRYLRSYGKKQVFTIEDFQTQLFDVLRRDLRRFLMPPAPTPSKLEHFRFHLSSKNFDALLAGAEKESKRPYVPARLEKDGQLVKLELRLRGQQHWHILGKKKSFKVRLPKGSLVDGHRVFNLINTPSPMLVDEEIILQLSRKLGVLTPHSSFVRVHLNGADLGVYHLETQPDESLLRNNRHVPGAIYSGNLPPSAETNELWNGTSRWKKVAWRNDEDREDFADLERLLKAISSATNKEFTDFARNEIDLEAFAAFDALDVAFGGDQHDFRENHKLQFDPYRGLWEPVAWSFRGFKHDPAFNLVENPLLLRLKLVPEYLTLRNRILYELLIGEGSTSSIRSRGQKIIRKIGHELASDPYWDAYKLLPRIDRFHRRLIRPMNLRRLALVFESELSTYSQRRSYLLAELQQNPLWLHLGNSQVAGESVQTPFSLIIDGRAGVKLSGFRVKWPAGCEQKGWRVRLGESAITTLCKSDQVELKQTIELHPLVGLAARSDPSARRGNVTSQMKPAEYQLVLESSCVPLEFEAEATQLATQSRIRSQPANPALLGRLDQKTMGPQDLPQFLPGDVGPHPTSLQKPAPKTIRLGPGELTFNETRIFDAHETVVIAAGTRIQMRAGASLVFLGPVSFEGTCEEPIEIEGLTADKAWGGIAIQGPATAGSKLSNLRVSGGSRPQYRMIPYPAMINIHDTRQIEVRAGKFGKNQGSGDVLHTAYVDDILIEDTSIYEAKSDAIDLEFTSGQLRRILVRRAGDEGLDLMGSDVQLVDSLIVDCAQNSISAGEESKLQIRSSLLARSKVGILAKNAAQVDLSGSLLYRCETGVRVYTRTVRYADDSRVQADVLYVVKSLQAITREDKKLQVLDGGRIQRRLPRERALDHLLHDVVGLNNWEKLADWLKAPPGEEL
jgi:CotH protein